MPVLYHQSAVFISFALDRRLLLRVLRWCCSGAYLLAVNATYKTERTNDLNTADAWWRPIAT